MIKKITLTLTLFVLTLSLQAQDVIEVQGFNYKSQTRDTVLSFPDGDHNEYEKILMVYSMRCKDGLVSPPIQGQTNIGCGEWDYSCNTYITDSTRVDSFFATAPSHVISNFSGGDIFEYTTQPTYTYYQSTQSEIIYNNTISENEFSVGTGNVDQPIPFGGQQTVGRSQLLYLADNLITQGLQAGNITGLKMEVASDAADFDKLRIRLKHSSKQELAAATLDEDGFEEVYFLDTDVASGNHFFKFHAPFNWDGSSNILIDVSYSRTGETSTTVKAETQAAISSLSANGTNDQLLEINGAGQVTLDEPMPSVSNEITISFWHKGGDALPVNSSIFEGTDNSNRRQINVHLPWSNSRIYWDCGNDGSNYDRIDKAANTADFKGVWNHWALTKNAVTGEMKMYLNGELWHSGTGKFNPIDIQKLRLGSSWNGNNPHHGKIDEFQIWNKELQAEDIKEWMTKAVTPAHPYYSNLVVYYNFDNAIGNTVLDASPNAMDGELVTPAIYRSWEGKSLKKNITESNDLPNMVFVQGEYAAMVNEITTLDSLINPENKVDEYMVDGTDLVLDNTNYYFASGEMPIYDDAGTQVGSVSVPMEGTINISELTHYTKRPAKYEIMSFVTPYGINLDLGIEGKSWVFDVTDFGPILKNNRRITMERGGQWQENIDIKFVFVKGTPSRNVVEINQVFPVTSESYTRIIDNVRFEPRQLMMPAEASNFKLKAAITGHGQQGEFIPRSHFLNVNGGNEEMVFEVWKECADNPIFPQGGTWIYDRAGWCPGQATDVHDFDITEWVTPGQASEIDYGMYTASGDSRYIVNVQMVSYGAPNFALDAELLDILDPSDNPERERYNPICGKPRVLIRNNGTTPLTSLNITYSVDGINPQEFTWEGYLEYLQTEEVELPPLDQTAFSDPTGTFYASISQPNGSTDAYENNNERNTDFKVVPMFGKDVVIRMVTNNVGYETSYRVYDDEGEELFWRGGTLFPNTAYNDTLFNLNGCYRLHVKDTDGDGLSWWVPSDTDGDGSIQIKSLGSAFTILEPEFGSFMIYEFYAGDVTPAEDVQSNKFLNIYPNPSKDIFYVEMEGYSNELQIDLVNQMGQVLQTKRLENNNLTFARYDFDLSGFADGIYYLKIQEGNATEVRKLIKME